MPFYGVPFYLTQFYGGAGGSSIGAVDVPQDLQFYRTNTDGVYVFHWGFAEKFIQPGLATVDFDLELDTVDTFDSSNLTEFTSATAISYQNGNVRKGFAVPVSGRVDGQTQTWYAHVRTHIGANTSDWSNAVVFTVLPKTQIASAEAIVGALPDENVYNKEDLLLPVASRNTTLYTVADTYAVEFDQARLEKTLIETNNYVGLCRDEQLFDNFGTYFNYPKPTAQQFVEYRACLATLVLASLVGGTVDAVKKIIKSFTGVTPDIELIRDFEDFFLSTILETPPETQDGSRTFFSTSSDYVNGTLSLVKNGNVLTDGVDYTENHVPPGYTLSTAPGSVSTFPVVIDYDPHSGNLPQAAVPVWNRFSNAAVTTESVSGGALHILTAGIIETDYLGYSRNPTDFNIGDSVRWALTIDSTTAMVEAVINTSNTQIISLGSEGMMVDGTSLLVRASFTGLSSYGGSNAAKIILNGGTGCSKRWSLGIWANQLNEEELGAHIAMTNTGMHDWVFTVKNDETLDVFLDNVLVANLVGGGNPDAPNGLVNFNIYGSITSNYVRRSISVPTRNLVEVFFGSHALVKNWIFRMTPDGFKANDFSPLYTMDCTVPHTYEAIVNADGDSVDLYVDGVFAFNHGHDFTSFGGHDAVNLWFISTVAATVTDFGYTSEETGFVAEDLQAMFDVGDRVDPVPVGYDNAYVLLSGTVDTTVGSETVSGTGTAFTTELTPGMRIETDDPSKYGVIGSIQSDTSLTLIHKWVGLTATGATAYTHAFNSTEALSGQVSFANGFTVVTGVNTMFSTEVKKGDVLTDLHGVASGVVDSITSNNTLNLSTVWTGATGPTFGKKLNYSELTLWDRSTLAHGFIIKVHNPGEFNLDEALIKNVTLPLIAAHLKVYFIFE